MAETFKVPKRVLVTGYGMQQVPPGITTENDYKAWLALKFPPIKTSGPGITPATDISNITANTVARTAVGLPGIGVDAARMAQGFRDWTEKKLGVPQANSDILTNISPLYAGVKFLSELPAGSAEFQSAFTDVTGKDLNYEPQTPEGEWAQRPIETAVPALLLRSPRGAVANPSRFVSGQIRDTLTGAAGGLAAEGANRLFYREGKDGLPEIAVNAGTQLALNMLGPRRTVPGEIKKFAPTKDELASNVSSAWKTVDDMNIKLVPTEVPKRIASLNPLYSDKDLFPKASKWISVLKNTKDNSFQWLQNTRSLISAEIRKGKDLGSEEKALMEIRDSIDDAIESGSFATQGPYKSPNEITSAVSNARKLTFIEKNADILEEAIRRGSVGGNDAANIRREFLNILKNKKLYDRFSKDEQAFIEKAARSNETAKSIADFVDDATTVGAISGGTTLGLPSIFIRIAGRLASGGIKAGSNARIQSGASSAVEAVRAGPKIVEAAKAVSQQDLDRLLARQRRAVVSPLYAEGLLGNGEDRR